MKLISLENLFIN